MTQSRLLFVICCTALLGLAGPAPQAQEASAQEASAQDVDTEDPSQTLSTQDLVTHLRGGEYAEAEQLARQRLAAGDASAALFLGRALAAQGRNQDAIQAYEQARDGNGGMPMSAGLAAARLQRLYGDWDAGTQALEQILEGYRQRHARDPKSLSAAELLAAGHAARDLAQGDPGLYRVALQAYEAAIAVAPSLADAHVAIGELLLHRYNNAEALEAFRAALGVDPEHPPALLGLARSQHFDHLSTTRASVERVLDLNPRDVDALALLATLQMELEDYAGAEATVAKALAVNPGAPLALVQRAALSLLGADQAAFDEQVAEARRLAPGYGAVYETLAEIVAQNRRYTEAAQFALLAVTLNRESWRGHALLGVNRLRLGDMKNARRSLEVAFRGDPYDPFSKNALELLDRLDGYRRVPSARFELVAEPREAGILAALVLPIAEQAFDTFAEAYDYHPRTPIRIEIYPRHEDFSVRTVGLVGVDIVGVSFGPVVAMDSPSAGVFGPLNLGSVLWHEIAHSFHLGLTGSKVPRWFSEGLAVYEERRARPGWGGDLSLDFLEAWRQDELPGPSQLNQVFLRPARPELLLHGYYLASLLMEFIEAEHGFEAITGMLHAYADGRSTAETIREALDREPADLDAAFEAFVSARFDRALAATAPSEQAPQGRYPQLMLQARAAMEAGELDQALEHLREAQVLLPELAGADGSYRLLAHLYEQRGETQLAIEQLQRNLAIDADDLEAHTSLARLYELLDDPAAATVVRERSMLIAPFDTDTHRRVAAAHESLQQWSRAIPARAAVVDLERTDPAGAHYLLARAHFGAGDTRAANKQVIKALEIAPLYEQALELLLSIRERAGAS